MISHSFKENELLTGISILAVLKHTNQLELTKCILIEPLLSYSQVLRFLKNANTKARSLEDLILKKSIPFTNFNNRFHDKLLLSINALILFEKMDLLRIKDNMVYFNAADNLFLEMGKTEGDDGAIRYRATHDAPDQAETEAPAGEKAAAIVI